MNVALTGDAGSVHTHAAHALVDQWLLQRILVRHAARIDGAEVLPDRGSARVLAEMQASVWGLSMPSAAAQILDVGPGISACNPASPMRRDQRSSSPPTWAALASSVLATFLPAAPDLETSRCRLGVKSQLDHIRGP